MKDNTPKFFGSTLLKKALEMPPGLAHWPDRSKPFDLSKSEVAAWVREQDDLVNFVVRLLMNRKIIVFDQATKTWSPNMLPESEDDKGKKEGVGRGRPHNELMRIQVLKTLSDDEGIKTERWRVLCQKHEVTPSSFYRYITSLKEDGLVKKTPEQLWVMEQKGLDYLIAVEAAKNKPQTEEEPE